MVSGSSALARSRDNMQHATCNMQHAKDGPTKNQVEFRGSYTVTNNHNVILIRNLQLQSLIITIALQFKHLSQE